MASDNKKEEKKPTSKEVAKRGDDVFNVVKLVANAPAPKVEVFKKTKDGR